MLIFILFPLVLLMLAAGARCQPAPESPHRCPSR